MSDRIVKTANALSTLSSTLYGTFTRNPSVAGMPISVSIELTNHCNLFCPECASGSGLMRRVKGFLDLGLFKKIASELSPYLYYINFYFQGEPMLHPEFFSFLEFSDKTYTVVATNGHFLTVENSEKLALSQLRKLTVSFDGMDKETYLEYRKNGDFDKVKEGIMNVATAIRIHRSPLKLEIQFLVNRFNENQIKNAKKFAAEAGASLKLKSMQVIHSDKTGRWMPTIEKFRRYREKDGTFSIKNSMPDRCFRLWLNPVITWDGKVLPCCFDKDAEFVMGDLKTDSFQSIWNGSAYKEFRRSILNGRNKISICNNCTSGIYH